MERPWRASDILSWLELQLQQQEVSWLLHWGWCGGGGEGTLVRSMGYSAVVLSHLIITLNTRTALRVGHAADKGTANTSCPLPWKGEMKKEERIIN